MVIEKLAEFSSVTVALIVVGILCFGLVLSRDGQMAIGGAVMMITLGIVTMFLMYY